MTTIPTIVVTPSAPAEAYGRDGKPVSGKTDSFGETMSRVLDTAVQSGHKADDQVMQALSGGGNLTDVVTALSHAELTLQTATVVRDRVVQAYQDIMKMPI
jgi:flagellar hook-basal body complex protein FliE